MLTELFNAKLVDPLHPQHGQQTQLYVRDGRMCGPPQAGVAIDRRIDIAGNWLLAGGIDIHTHIGGGKVNLARLLMPASADQRQEVIWPTIQTGELYSQMGYTTCFEPAMLLSSARHTHLELADTPQLDSGAYVVLGNEDWLLQALSDGVEDASLDALVGWSVQAAHALAVKVVNAGGISAFKYNQRMLRVDEPHARYGVTPRDVVRRLAHSVQRVGLPHPLHVHASNLGVPGNIASTLATLEAAEGCHLHLTHAQFNCYSDKGPYGMGSAAAQLAGYVNEHPQISIDVGQIVFGQTVTISADTAAQYRNKKHANRPWWIVSDVECQAGCGVVPMRYEDRQYVHSLQWTIGLELMLLIEDPWRVFLTTDHPNGGPFTSYPHLLRLLMDRSYRQSMLETIHPRAAQNSLLQELTREYTLDEVAIVTRAAPAKILGLTDRGTLRDGSLADLAVYRPADDWQKTFSQPTLVMKQGVEVVRDGQPTRQRPAGHTISADPAYDEAHVHSRFQDLIEQTLQLPLASLAISQREMQDLIRRPLTQPLVHSSRLMADGTQHAD